MIGNGLEEDNEWVRQLGNIDLDVKLLLKKADKQFEQLQTIKHSMNGNFSNVYSAIVTSFLDLASILTNNELYEEKIATLTNSMGEEEKKRVLHEAMLDRILYNINQNSSYYNTSISNEYTSSNDEKKKSLFAQHKVQGIQKNPYLKRSYSI